MTAAVPDPRFRDQIAEVPRQAVAAPGDLLAVLLRDRGMTQAALAAMLGRPAQMVSEIVTGKKRVTATTAIQLQCVFGLPALVWLGLQAHTDLQAAANQRGLDCAHCEGTGSEPDDSADERTYPCQQCNGAGS